MTETILVAFSKHEFKEFLRGAMQELLNEQNLPKDRQHAAHEYLNMAEASRYLQLPQNTLYAFCHERRIPYSKRGKRNYFLRADLDEWLSSSRKKSVKEIEVEAMANLRKGGKK